MCSSPNIEAHTTIHHVKTLLEPRLAAWKDDGFTLRLPYNLNLFLLQHIPVDMASSSPGLLGENRLESLKRMMDGKKLQLDQKTIDHLKKQALQKAQRLREQVSLTVPDLFVLSMSCAQKQHTHTLCRRPGRHNSQCSRHRQQHVTLLPAEHRRRGRARYGGTLNSWRAVLPWLDLPGSWWHFTS